MCTSISYKGKYTYFGRNLDLDKGYKESVTITPRNYEFRLRCMHTMKSHYAMIGMATVVDDMPLYYEATNEKGLSMAGLNFPQNAVYYEYTVGKDNVAPFEFIPWVLGQCSCITETKALLRKLCLVDISYSKQLPLTPLHWMISDKERSIVVESLSEGIVIHDNPFGVLTNNPPFDYHLLNMNNYMSLNNGPAINHFNKDIPLYNYSLGMGALGLPGDFSSTSRFVRAFFVKENSVSDDNEKTCVNQFFHILNTVSMPKGCVKTNDGFEYTRYSSCCNADKGIYYYVTYDSFDIKSVNMHDVDKNASHLFVYAVTGM